MSGTFSASRTAIACLAAILLLSSCGREKHGATNPAGETAATSSPEADMLRAAIANPVYLLVGMQRPMYCEPPNARDLANISVQRADGHQTAYINRIPASVPQHEAVMALVKPTLASQSSGMISGGTCYAVDAALFQRYDQPGVGLWMPLGSIKATS